VPGNYNVIATSVGIPNSVTFALANLPIPTLLSPTGITTDTTPTYLWTRVAGATQYRYTLQDNYSNPLYSKIVPASSCGATTCSNTPTNVLPYGNYQWEVQAMTGGVWQTYSPFKPFSIQLLPKAGLWTGPWMGFYIAPNQTQLSDFSIYVSITGCGNYKITHKPLTPIVNRAFSFGGTFYAQGTVDSMAAMHGTLGLNYFYIPGCGYLKGGPFSWKATWKNTTQPSVIISDTLTPVLVESMLNLPDNGGYTVELVSP
jgi:hypothetical protein